MNILKLILTPALLLVTLAPSMVNAQGYPVQIGQPVYQQPVYSPVLPAATPLKVDSAWDKCDCQCPPSGTGPCTCKNLNCKIKLPHNCKKQTIASKKPIPCKIYGKIPVLKYNSNCLSKHCDFRYITEVPQVHCVCEECMEIGKKLIECLPGCCFSVCIPKYCCETRTVECKLSPKEMPMQLWKRLEGGTTKYDVHVINNADPASQDHAGGMPAKWLIMHCGTADEFHSRFPGAVCSDGNPILGAKANQKKAEPKATAADVELKLVVDKEKLAQYFEQESNADEAIGNVEEKSAAVTNAGTDAVDKS